jgi:alpha-amylase
MADDRGRKGLTNRGAWRVVRLVGLVTWVAGVLPGVAAANPWNGKVVLQAFWWDCKDTNYPNDWYTYLAKLAPRLREMGFDGIWVPSPCKAKGGTFSMGYDLYDHYDLGDKHQKGTTPTQFGDKDAFLRLVAVAHANGLDVYPEIVLNHVAGGQLDTDAAGSDQWKKFRYVAFSGKETGRWAKDWWNFHPNPDHKSSEGNWCEEMFGPDCCYLDAIHGGGGNGLYMRDQARAWFVWFRKQTGADGFRFDAVKHFPPYVVEDLLWNAMGPGLEYFAVGEYVEDNQATLDDWANSTQNRCGTFDFALRSALANLIEAGGFFDLGSLPNAQQKNRFKTVPFINNHDTWRGAFWDSQPGSGQHDDRDGDWRRNGDELAPTIDPDNPRADVAYAAVFAVDGSPMVFYEDLFINYNADREKADPATYPVRKYVTNLVWCHQKLNFKDGAYKVRFQGSSDLLIIERSGKALIGLNDHGTDAQSAWAPTDFGANVTLHDYSGSTSEEPRTDSNGWVNVTVPAMSYAVWAPAGVTGGFSPPGRHTTQEFQFADDVGDANSLSLGYGGQLVPTDWRTAGAVWIAAGTQAHVWLYTDGECQAEVAALNPGPKGEKSTQHGQHATAGKAMAAQPMEFVFTATGEGYHRLAARLAPGQAPTRGYLKVEYEAPATSNKF